MLLKAIHRRHGICLDSLLPWPGPGAGTWRLVIAAVSVRTMMQQWEDVRCLLLDLDPIRFRVFCWTKLTALKWWILLHLRTGLQGHGACKIPLLW